MNFYPRSPCGERPYDGLIASANFCHFYPRSPCGERLISPHSAPDNGNFYPRSPCGERLFLLRKITITVDISIHALLAESDFWRNNRNKNLLLFLSTLSLRRATGEINTRGSVKVFLSTLSLRRATHYDNYNLHCVEISIHALLAESDLRVLDGSKSSMISIHALLAESDYTMTTTICTALRFLSTLSLRRATNDAINGCNPDFISIHALLAESDRQTEQTCQTKTSISIHALLAESDSQRPPGTTRTTYFYPRSPCGERPTVHQ